MKNNERPPSERSAFGVPRSAPAFVALGSNLGDSRALVLAAMDRLESFSAAPLLRSSLWQSTPVDCPPGTPMFVNAVVGLLPRAGETAASLLKKLHEVEQDFGRQPKKVMNESRPLDLDLITFGNETRASETLVLPHPRAHLRRFVLQPLSEIASELILPGQTRTVAELLAGLDSGEALVRLQRP